MTSKQKFVKYLATALAVLLIIVIAGGIIAGIMFLTGVFPKSEKPAPAVTASPYRDEPSSSVLGKKDRDSQSSSGHSSKGNHASDDFISKSYTFQEIENITVDTSVYSVFFIPGSGKDIVVELTNVHKDYLVEKKNHTLVLKDPDMDFHSFNQNHFFDLLENAGKERKATIQITLPKDFIANEIELDGGVGDITLEKVTAKELDIDAGTGNINGFQVTAESVDIDGGTGNMEFTDSAFGDTDIDAGVGNVIFSGTAHGRTTIDCGVGNTKFSLSDSKNNYALSLEKGLGTIRLNGDKVKFEDNYSENSGAPYSLNITGGVGNVTIDFAD